MPRKSGFGNVVSENPLTTLAVAVVLGLAVYFLFFNKSGFGKTPIKSQNRKPPVKSQNRKPPVKSQNRKPPVKSQNTIITESMGLNVMNEINSHIIAMEEYNKAHPDRTIQDIVKSINAIPNDTTRNNAIHKLPKNIQELVITEMRRNPPLKLYVPI
jgi:hypothetical protein